jgi:short-subunit dehydrogenase
MMKNKMTVIHGLMNYMMANSVRFAPRKMVATIARMMQGEPV